jgi:hypothetical protein
LRRSRVIELAKPAPPDGYTIVLASTTPFAALPALNSNLPCDPEKDFYGSRA